MHNLVNCEGVQTVRTDTCQFGMMSRTGGIGSKLGHVLKPIGFITNSKFIANELSRRCPRDHAHVPLVAGRAADAAIYPQNLCRSICRGFAAQLKSDRGLEIVTPALTSSGLRSLNMLCREASGMELTCEEHLNGNASHAWGRQDSSDKAPPIDRERGDEEKSCSRTTYQEASGLQQSMKEKGVSIGDVVMQIVDKTNGEEI